MTDTDRQAATTPATYTEKKTPKPKQKAQGISEIQFSSNIGLADFNTKVAAIKRLLGKNNRVRCRLRLKGREITHTDIGFNVMRRVVDATLDDAKVNMEPKLDGRLIVMLLVPKATNKAKEAGGK